MSDSKVPPEAAESCSDRDGRDPGDRRARNRGEAFNRRRTTACEWGYVAWVVAPFASVMILVAVGAFALIGPAGRIRQADDPSSSSRRGMPDGYRPTAQRLAAIDRATSSRQSAEVTLIDLAVTNVIQSELSDTPEWTAPWIRDCHRSAVRGGEYQFGEEILSIADALEPMIRVRRQQVTVVTDRQDNSDEQDDSESDSGRKVVWRPDLALPINANRLSAIEFEAILFTLHAAMIRGDREFALASIALWVDEFEHLHAPERARLGASAVRRTGQFVSLVAHTLAAGFWDRPDDLDQIDTLTRRLRQTTRVLPPWVAHRGVRFGQNRNWHLPARRRSFGGRIAELLVGGSPGEANEDPQAYRRRVERPLELIRLALAAKRFHLAQGGWPPGVDGITFPHGAQDTVSRDDFRLHVLPDPFDSAPARSNGGTAGVTASESAPGRPIAVLWTDMTTTGRRTEGRPTLPSSLPSGTSPADFRLFDRVMYLR